MQNSLKAKESVLFLITLGSKLGQLQGWCLQGLRGIIRGPIPFHAASSGWPKMVATLQESKKGKERFLWIISVFPIVKENLF